MMELISALIGVIGVVIGWILNELTTVIRERPKLCFQMVVTSPSEHGIEIFNMGAKPFVLENFEICYKKKLLVDCHMPEENRIILPYHNAVYTLSEQEADALQWHCQKEHFEECKVIAAKGTLSVPLFAIRASIRTENHGSVD